MDSEKYLETVYNSSNVYTREDIKKAFDAGVLSSTLKNGWHNLKDNPNDLPEEGSVVAVILPFDNSQIIECGIAYYNDGIFECADFDLTEDLDFA